MKSPGAEFQELYRIISVLRGPDGCPWDIKQTPDSMKSGLLEEAYECVDAIIDGDDSHLREELGDVFLLVTMLSYMKEQENSFSVSDALESISQKLIRRHPHVFGDPGDSDAKTSDEVVAQWDDIKRTVELRTTENGIFAHVPRHLPPLERAYELQKKAAKVGFDWENAPDVVAKAAEEIGELREAVERSEPSGMEEEIGDLLFSLINVARFLDIDPAIALHKTNAKFVRRFAHVEASMKEDGKQLSRENFALMDAYWDEAKGIIE